MNKSKYFILILFSLFLQLKSFSQTKLVENCKNSKLIVSQINKLMISEYFKSDYDSLLSLMKLNIPDSLKDCYFPANDNQFRELLNLVDSSVRRSATDYSSLKFIIELYLNEKHNSELEEILMEKIPIAVSKNIYYFLFLYDQCSQNKRELIMKTLDNFRNKNDYAQFKSNLNEGVKIIQEIKNHIEAEEKNWH